MSKPDESGLAGAHRAIGAAAMGFEAHDALAALSACAAEIIVAHYLESSRPKILREFDEATRARARQVADLMSQIGLGRDPWKDARGLS
jgi:hypothetical protein